MKRSKKLILLSSVLFVVCIAAFAMSRYERKQEEIKTSGETVLSVPADSIETVSWKFLSDGLAFSKSDEGWIYDDDEAFPVSEEKINNILAHFEEFSAAFIIQNVEDYSQYGLDDPECTISFSTNDANYEIKLGDFSKMDEQRYVDIGDGNVYLAVEDPMDYLATALSGVILHDSAPGFESVIDISFSGSENYTLVKQENSPNTYNEGDIYFAQLDGQELPLNTEYVTEYLNTVTTMELLDYVSYNVTDEELEAYGLNEPEISTTVNYSYTDEDDKEVSSSFTFHIGQNQEELEAYNEAVANEETELPDVTKYVRIGQSQIIYKLDDVDFITLSNAAYNDLRHREVFWADFETVTQMDVRLENETHSFILSSDEEDKDAYVWLYGEDEIEVDSLWNALEGISADSFTEEKTDGVEEISIILYLDNENFPQTEIVFYRYDGSLCLAQIDGIPVSLVPRSDVIDFVEEVQAIILN